jgi:hypothetical protein
MVETLPPSTISVIGWAVFAAGLTIVGYLYAISWFRRWAYWKVRLVSIPIEFVTFTVLAWSWQSSSGIPPAVGGGFMVLFVELGLRVFSSIWQGTFGNWAERLNPRIRRPPGDRSRRR